MGGREKDPAAICRKVAYAPKWGGSIEVWGDGLQTRSFLYIDECIEVISSMKIAVKRWKRVLIDILTSLVVTILILLLVFIQVFWRLYDKLRNMVVGRSISMWYHVK
tara:strand:+ start:163 stop:483 length:321 start_codon:yes stop_codon:yes gene_type:complete